MILTPEDRERLISDIAAAVYKRSTDTALSTEEIHYVRLAIHKEAQSIKLRQAVIEKTITGLVWLAVVGLGALLLEWAKNHGYRP